MGGPARVPSSSLTGDPHDLERFVTAQAGSYERALADRQRLVHPVEPEEGGAEPFEGVGPLARRERRFEGAARLVPRAPIERPPCVIHACDSAEGRRSRQGRHAAGR